MPASSPGPASANATWRASLRASAPSSNGGRPGTGVIGRRLPIAGRSVVIVDDGLATGASAHAGDHGGAGAGPAITGRSAVIPCCSRYLGAVAFASPALHHAVAAIERAQAQGYTARELRQVAAAVMREASASEQTLRT